MVRGRTRTYLMDQRRNEQRRSEYSTLPQHLVSDKIDLLSNEERPCRRGLMGILWSEEANWKCLILTALIYGCLFGIVWCRNARVTKVVLDFSASPIIRTRESSLCEDGYLYFPGAFIFMLYLLYLVDCWHSKVRILLSLQKSDTNSVYRKIHEMKTSPPIVWWKAVSYHYNKKLRQITRYRNGSAYISSQVFYERVNSRASSGSFFYALCGMKDISKELIDLDKFPVTKIKFSKGFIFGNPETAAEFEDQRARFFQNVEQFDDYVEIKEGLELASTYFKDSMISWAKPEDPPWFGKTRNFWISSFLLLSWPFRIFLELNVAHSHYKVTKLFGSQFVQDNEPIHDVLSERLRGVRTSRRSPLVSPISSEEEETEENSALQSLHEMKRFGKLEVKGRSFDPHPFTSFHGMPRSVTLVLSEGRDEMYPDSFSLCSFSLVPSYSEALLLSTPSHNNNNSHNGPSHRIPEVYTEPPMPSINLTMPSNRPSGINETLTRSLSGVELDLTRPIIISLPEGTEEPPSYTEALRTSRPVFLTHFARLRRCLTERDVRRTRRPRILRDNGEGGNEGTPNDISFLDNFPPRGIPPVETSEP